MPRPHAFTPDILEAALSGLDAQRQRLETQIAEIRRLLDPRFRGATPPATPKAPTARKKWTMSAAGRARIAAAQRKRWAAQKAVVAPPQPKKVGRKRRLSPAGRKAIIEATNRRWAAVRAAKQAS